MEKIKVSVNICCNRDTIFATIKKMEQFPNFMRDILSLDVLDEDKNELVTKWEIDIDGTPIKWIEEDVFDDTNKLCSFRTLKGDFKYWGSWILEEIDKNNTKITLEAEFDWEISNLRNYIGNILTKKARISLRGMLNAIKKKEEKGRAVSKNIRIKGIPKFAFIAHPYDLDVFATTGVSSPSLMEKNKRTIERAFRWMPPFKRETVQISSIKGTKVKGDIYLVPLICEQILHMDSKFVLDKTIQAGKIAQKNGAKIVGLGAYLSGVGRKGILVDKALDVPVTIGINYTIAVSIDATLKVADKAGIDLSKADVTIIGATGNIGSICSEILAEHVNSINLVARNQKKLELLYKRIVKKKNIKADYTDNAKKAVKNSDIVMIATNTPETILSTKDLPEGCIVCDISIPHNIVKEDAEERGILVIDGGLVKCPSDINFDYLGLPSGLAYACLSEVIILSLEGLYDSYSLGNNISLEKVNKIQKIAEKHGFYVSEFRSFGEPVNDDAINRVHKKIVKRKKKVIDDINNISFIN